MKSLMKLGSAGRTIIAAALLCSGVTAMAAPTTPQAQLAEWTATAGQPASVERGKAFFSKQHGKDISCTSCHGSVPTSAGKHLSTGKVLEPLAPAGNAKSLTDSAKVAKWFKRNCNDVLGRECSAQEKADVLAFLISLK